MFLSLRNVRLSALVDHKKGRNSIKNQSKEANKIRKKSSLKDL